MNQRDDMSPTQHGRWIGPHAKSFMRQDAHRWLKAGAVRCAKPESPHAIASDRGAVDRRRLMHLSILDSRGRISPALAVRSHLAAARFVAVASVFHRALTGLAAKYDPDQPRVPAGNPDGGQWSSGSVGTSAREDADAIEFGAARRTRGHHYVTREIFGKEPLPAETRAVLEKATTGRILDERNNRYDHDHRLYNLAVREHFDQFIEANAINVRRMTPNQAQEFLDGVLKSTDPRIRNYNTRLLMREIMRRVRPRGGD